MLAPTHSMAGIVRDANLRRQEREACAVSTDVIVWLSEFGAVVIPSVGFFIRSQPFFHVLVTARGAPALCGDSKTLAGLGIPGTDAARFEAQLQRTAFLVYVAALNRAKVQWALQLERITGAEESAAVDTEADAAVA